VGSVEVGEEVGVSGVVESMFNVCMIVEGVFVGSDYVYCDLWGVISELNGFADGLLLRLKERMDVEVQVAAYVDRWL
jgi:hypothetical protein